jgi:hypothetical protein
MDRGWRDLYELDDDELAEQSYAAPPLAAGKRTRAQQLVPGPQAVLRSASGAPVASGAQERLQAARGSSGDRLPVALLSRFEQSLGTDLGDVRVHTGGSAEAAAQALGANAFAHGRDIYFAQGQYQPDSPAGQRLLAHEVAHTAQTGSASAGTPMLSAPGDAVERDADAAADRMMAGQSASVVPGMGYLIGRDEEKEKKLDFAEWTTRYADKIATSTRNALAGMELEPGSVFVTWKDMAGFVAQVATILTNTPSSFLALLPLICHPESSTDAINRGRNADADGKSEDAFDGAVGTELRNILARRIAESLKRVSQRYAQATNQVYLKQLGPVGPPNINDPGDPAASDIVPGSPMDLAVIPASIGKLKVDLVNYQKAHPDEKEAVKPRQVNYCFCATEPASTGKLNWVRVTDTCDPPVTVEDVALSLYGNAAMASMITPVPPLYGFAMPAMLVRYEEWKKLPGNDGSDPEGQDKDKNDPAKQILTGPDADKAALDQSRGAPGTEKGDKAAVAQRIVAMLALVDAMVADVGGIAGLNTGDLAALKGRLTERKGKVLATPENASGQQNPWDAQTAKQLDLLGACASGTATAARNWAGLTKGGGDKTPAFFTDPIKNLAAAFVDAAAVSDLIETGQQRLAIAGQKLRTYPIDVTEGILAYLRQLLRETSNTVFRGSGSFDIERTTGKSLGDLDKKEEDLRVRCAKLRDLIVSNPAAAQAELDKIQGELKELQLYVVVSALVGKAGDLDNTLTNLSKSFGADRDWSKLRHPFDKSKQTGSKQQKYEAAQGEISALRNTLFLKVIKPAKEGRLEEGYKELAPAQKQYEAMFPRVAQLIDDEETKEKWIKIGILIGAGIMSAGFGDAIAAIGAAELGLSGGALLAVKGAAEAGAFTLITQTTLEKDPTLASISAAFFQNWATFAMVGKAMESYKAALPAFAETFKGQVVGGVGMFVAHCSAGVAAADARRYAETGQHLSEDEIHHAVEEGFLVTIGTLIGQRLTHKFLHGFNPKAPDIQKKIATVNTERDATKVMADKLKGGGGKAADGQAVTNKEKANLAKEKEVIESLDAILKDPEAAKKQGWSEEDLALIRNAKAALDTAAATNKLLELLAGLKNIGGDTFVAEGKGRFDEVVAQHRAAGHQVTESQDMSTLQRTAVITHGGKTVRVVEDLTEGAVTARPDGKPMKPGEAAGYEAAVLQRHAEKTYAQNKADLLARLKKTTGNVYEIDGTTTTLGEVVQKMRDMGWQTMEIVDNAELAPPPPGQNKPRTARFEAHPEPNPTKAPFESKLEVITVKETAPTDPTKTKTVTPEQWKAARAAIAAGQVPRTSDLPDTPGNLEGTVKLEKLHRDAYLNSEKKGLVQQADADVAAALDDTPTQNLNGIIQRVWDKQSGGKPIYREQGPPLRPEEAATFGGGVCRGVNYEALGGNKAITQAYYDRLRALPDNDPAWGLPKSVADIQYGAHAHNIGKLMKILPPDPFTDLAGGGPIGRGDSPGWWGAMKDSNVPEPPPGQLDARAFAQAVAAEGLAGGGVVFGLDNKQVAGAAVDITGAKVQARRPTTFDSLWQTQYNPNPDAKAGYGITTPDPSNPSSNPVREVLLPVMPVSSAKTRVPMK